MGNHEGNEAFIINFIRNLTKIKRFDIAVSFLLAKEKLIIQGLLDKLQETQFLEENEYKDFLLLYKLKK
jgi:hypothetical protein